MDTGRLLGGGTWFAAHQRNAALHQTDAFANWNVPLSWEPLSHWRVQSRLDASLGWLGGDGDHGAVATIGPTLVLTRKGFPISVEGGVSPTVLTREQFGSKDFGTIFQFTSHGAVNFDFGRHWRASYRYQHMSNAHLVSQNPGLNLHVFGISYRF